MTARVALCMALLDGQVLNVKNVFRTIGLTNASREISRMIEKPFNLEVSRTPRKGKNRYGGDITWVDFRLNKSDRNQEGIKLMQEYIEKHSRKPETTQTEPKNDIKSNQLF